jgi:hypothetical protein
VCCMCLQNIFQFLGLPSFLIASCHHRLSVFALTFDCPGALPFFKPLTACAISACIGTSSRTVAVGKCTGIGSPSGCSFVYSSLNLRVVSAINSLLGRGYHLFATPQASIMLLLLINISILSLARLARSFRTNVCFWRSAACPSALLRV